MCILHNLTVGKWCLYMGLLEGDFRACSCMPWLRGISVLAPVQWLQAAVGVRGHHAALAQDPQRGAAGGAAGVGCADLPAVAGRGPGAGEPGPRGAALGHLVLVPPLRRPLLPGVPRPQGAALLDHAVWRPVQARRVCRWRQRGCSGGYHPRHTDVTFHVILTSPTRHSDVTFYVILRLDRVVRRCSVQVMLALFLKR